jgi:hypothetical protein
MRIWEEPRRNANYAYLCATPQAESHGLNGIGGATFPAKAVTDKPH